MSFYLKIPKIKKILNLSSQYIDAICFPPLKNFGGGWGLAIDHTLKKLFSRVDKLSSNSAVLVCFLVKITSKTALGGNNDVTGL